MPKSLERGEVSAQYQGAGEVSMGDLSQEEMVCGMESVCVAVSNGDNPASSSQGFVSSIPPNKISDTAALLKV